MSVSLIKENRVADMLAKEGAKDFFFDLIKLYAPPPQNFISNILVSDVIGICNIRRVPMNYVLVNGKTMARNYVTYSNCRMALLLL